MTKSNQPANPILPPVEPPAELLGNIMAAVAQEPPTAWENAQSAIAPSQPASVFTMALTLSVALAGIVLIGLLVLAPSVLVSQLQGMLWVVRECAGFVVSGVRITGMFVDSGLALIRPTLVITNQVWSTAAMLLRIVSSGPLLGIVISGCALVIAGQLLLLRLLFTRPVAQHT